MERFPSARVSSVLLGFALMAALWPRSADAQISLSNSPFCSDSEPQDCFTDFYPLEHCESPERLHQSSFTLPSGLSGVVRSAVYTRAAGYGGGLGFMYQIAVTGGPGTVAKIQIPFAAAVTSVANDSAMTSVHITGCFEPTCPCTENFGYACDERAPPLALCDPCFGCPSPLSCFFPTVGTVPTPGTPVTSSITALTGGTYTTEFSGLPTGATSRIFGIASAIDEGLRQVTATLTDSSGATATATALTPSPPCGNGRLDAGEGCDDGNELGGDCCGATCQPEPSGSPCAADANVCTLDVCNGAGACGHPLAPDGQSCDNGTPCMAADVCQGGACVDAAACGAIAVAEVHVKKIKSTFTGQKGDAVTAQGFVPASVAQLLRRDGQQVAIGGAQTDEVPVTNEVRRKVGKSGKAKIKLKLNPVGKRLLGDFAEQGRSLEVTVRLTVRRRNEPETLLRFLVSVVKKR